ncbi:MAG: penicillin-binding protein 2 [Candidatus Omnitrophica bacterium]|nr:penicillin-binding protein 2 [Candidatus Omnitrophota bacterium]
MARPANDRIIGVLLVGLALLGLLWVRCVWLQLVAAGRYSALAAAQHRSTEVLRARRGTLYDRAGRPLAMGVGVPSVFANARAVEAKRDVARQLADMIGRDVHAIEERLEKDKGFVWVARHVEPAIAPSIRMLSDVGVGLLEEPKRLYPHGRLGSHLIGFVDIDQYGLEGLELAFNGVLQGQDGWRSTLRDAKGNVLIGPWTIETRPMDGYDVVLTIDSVVQEVAEETLEWGVKKYHAKGGSIIVMEPATGAILALANAPSYDPNAPAVAPAEARRNRAVTDLFEPGSIFKIVTASALLEEKKVTPDEQVFCEDGSYHTVARHVLHDHRPHGLLSFHDVIKFSSNIGTAKAAQRLKPDELYRYIQAFGFGRRTGIDIPGEVSGLVHPPARWSKLSPFIVPIGQEIAVTPIQLAVMTAVVANGGNRMRPYLMERVQTPDGRVIRSHAPMSPTHVISPETAAILQGILTSVIESGTGQLASVQGLAVAGKTGTAQKLEPDGRYSHARFVASFVGFGPVPDPTPSRVAEGDPRPVAGSAALRHGERAWGDPRFVIVVCMDEPHPLYFGGVVSTPMFKRVVEGLMGYWELDRGGRSQTMAQLQ